MKLVCSSLFPSLKTNQAFSSYIYFHMVSIECLENELISMLQVVNCGELLSKWVGESTKNIEAIFEEAKHSDAILVFDEAEGLFGSRTTMT